MEIPLTVTKIWLSEITIPLKEAATGYLFPNSLAKSMVTYLWVNGELSWTSQTLSQ